MENFIFRNETKIIFGKNTEKSAGKEILEYSKKILLHYGGGSIKRTGLYDTVVKSLKEADIDFLELSGVKPNPRLSLVKEGIEICKEKDIDFILAVGGGSVIDSAKAIAAGAKYEGDVWDFFEGKNKPKEVVQIGVILTIPATGSETSDTTVITNEDGYYKRAFSDNILRPKFAILNPGLTYTLPSYQTAAGGVDIMSHVFERYFTNTKNVDLTDRLCEAALKTMIKNIPLVLKNPTNYAARAEIMWTGTIAHNGLLGTGKIEDWGSHMIAHELSGIYDLTHGAALSIVFPAWMKYVYTCNTNRFLQYASRVWNLDIDFEDNTKTISKSIEVTKNFFKSLGMPISLKDASIPADKIDEMAEKCTEKGPVGSFKKLYKDDVVEILKITVENTTEPEADASSERNFGWKQDLIK